MRKKLHNDIVVNCIVVYWSACSGIGDRHAAESAWRLDISDGNEGIQWNAGYRPGDGFVWPGVNLEGMKDDDWPVARLVEREISRPPLLTRYPREGSQDPMKSPCSGRVTRGSFPPDRPIREANLGLTLSVLDRLDVLGWADALRGARGDPRKQHCGRRKVPVTVRASKQHRWERRVEMYVSPHLKIGMSMVEIAARGIREARGNLEALYELTAEQSMR